MIELTAIWLAVLQAASAPAQPAQPAQLAQQSSPIPPDFKLIVGITTSVIIVIILVILPLYDRIAKAIGRVTAGSLVGDHNSSTESHADVRQALALLNRSVADLQRQIEAESEHRRDSLEAVQRQLENAIRLLSLE